MTVGDAAASGMFAQHMSRLHREGFADSVSGHLKEFTVLSIGQGSHRTVPDCADRH